MVAVPTPAQLEAIAPSWLHFLRADEWGRTWKHAPAPEKLGDPETFIHHTAGGRRGNDPVAAMLSHQKWAQDSRGYATVAYDQLVHLNKATNEVTIMGGREGWRSAATRDRNEEGEAICLSGYFHPGHPLSEQPTPRELEGLAFAVAWSIAHGWSAPDTRVMGHRENPAHPGATSCPGDFLFPHLPSITSRAFKLLAEAVRPPLPPPVPEEEPDMSTAVLWRPAGYKNVFLTGVGPASNVTPAVFDHHVANGVKVIFETEPHKGALATVLFQSGMVESQLEKI